MDGEMVEVGWPFEVADFPLVRILASTRLPRLSNAFSEWAGCKSSSSVRRRESRTLVAARSAASGQGSPFTAILLGPRDNMQRLLAHARQDAKICTMQQLLTTPCFSRGCRKDRLGCGAIGFSKSGAANRVCSVTRTTWTRGIHVSLCVLIAH